MDIGAEEGYQDFINNDKKLINQPIKKMSNLTQALLDSINYNDCATIRKENFNYLHKQLKNSNSLEVNLVANCVPMVYPYWCEDPNLREKLIAHKIYAPIYWTNVLDWCKKTDLEYKMAKEIVYIPVDQRYGTKNLKKILRYV